MPRSENKHFHPQCFYPLLGREIVARMRGHGKVKNPDRGSRRAFVVVVVECSSLNLSFGTKLDMAFSRSFREHRRV